MRIFGIPVDGPAEFSVIIIRWLRIIASQLLNLTKTIMEFSTIQLGRPRRM